MVFPGFCFTPRPPEAISIVVTREPAGGPSSDEKGDNPLLKRDAADRGEASWSKAANTSSTCRDLMEP